MSLREESAIQTASGRRFSPLDPEPGAIEVEDIAHALSHLCRFGGHSTIFYSVAQHCCLVADAVERGGAQPEEVLWALLHDASEAYLGDLPHPLKHRSALGAFYREIEGPLQAAILERFGLPAQGPDALKRIDRAVLALERSRLMVPADDGWWPEVEGVEPLAVELEPWPSPRAEAEFLARFRRLEAAR
jgi:hypothetical protein